MALPPLSIVPVLLLKIVLLIVKETKRVEKFLAECSYIFASGFDILLVKESTGAYYAILNVYLNKNSLLL